VPSAIVRMPPRGLARLVLLCVVVAAGVAAISTTMPLIDDEEWRLCNEDRETYDLVYGGVLRLAYLGCFVPPLLEAGWAVSMLRGYRESPWASLIHAFAILEALVALSFAFTCKQDAGRDLLIVGHLALMGALTLLVLVGIDRHRTQPSVRRPASAGAAGDERVDSRAP